MRADDGLAFLLQYENVAWYDAGAVRILDRRVYPMRTEFVVCRHHAEVARAISDMVTQSAGPYQAAGMGMALAAAQCAAMPRAQAEQYLNAAAHTLSHARPTTALRMEVITTGCRAAAMAALEAGQPADLAVFEYTVEMIDQKYRRIERLAGHLADLLPDTGTVLTQCYAETAVGMLLRQTRAAGKNIALMCAETRPYFQGARLTASVGLDQGADVTVISDNMPAAMMQRGLVDVFTSGADAITMDGHVVNKIGTLQIALACRHFGLPYYCTGAPDAMHPDLDSVHIELRDPEGVLDALGSRTVKPGVRGLYPAFDATPPELVTGIVTDLGVYSPFALPRYFEDGGDPALLT